MPGKTLVTLKLNHYQFQIEVDIRTINSLLLHGLESLLLSVDILIHFIY